jgi:cytochrome c553
LKHSIFLLTVFFAQTSVWAVSPETQNIITSCSACHGEKGISNNDEWPNLAGQKKNYLLSQLKNFKSGERESALMSAMAKTLNSDQMDAIATYYSEIGSDK